jgi:hypothetical protein
LQRLGLPLPNVPMPGVSRRDDIFVYQVILTYLGLGLSAWAAWKRASRAKNLNVLPQVMLMLVFVALTLLIFSQPMQARGSLL